MPFYTQHTDDNRHPFRTLISKEGETRVSQKQTNMDRQEEGGHVQSGC